VTGPAAVAGAKLAVLPISVETWEDWRREQPETTVLAPDPRMARQYSRDPYTSYFGNDLLRFPVQPLPSPAHYPLKTPVVAVGGEAAWTAFPFPSLASVTNVQQPLPGPQAELARALAYRPQWRTVRVNVEALPSGSAVVYASYFAWYATHQVDTTWVAPGATP